MERVLNGKIWLFLTSQLTNTSALQPQGETHTVLIMLMIALKLKLNFCFFGLLGHIHIQPSLSFAALAVTLTFSDCFSQ